MVSLTTADLLVTGVIPMRVAQNYAYDETVQEPIVQVIGFIGRVTIIASFSSPTCLQTIDVWT